MHLTNVGPLWLRRYALAVSGCTLLLLIAGGLVTSNDAALSVPDWPTSWGSLFPPLQGGIRYEFAHRVLALLATLMTIGLALAMRTRLAWTALLAVAAQAALGGAGVLLAEPLWIAIAHACLGQLQFGLVVAVTAQAFGATPSLSRPLIFALILAQTALGAAVRYGVIGLAAHLGGALVATLYLMWVSLSLLMNNMDNPSVRRPAMLLLSLTFSQVFLGIASYMARVVYVNAPQPMPLLIFFTVAHVAFGSLVFGAAVLFTTLARPQQLPVSGGPVSGVVTA